MLACCFSLQVQLHRLHLGLQLVVQLPLVLQSPARATRTLHSKLPQPSTQNPTLACGWACWQSSSIPAVHCWQTAAPMLMCTGCRAASEAYPTSKVKDDPFLSWVSQAAPPPPMAASAIVTGVPASGSPGPLQLQFSEFQILEMIGEGSFGRVSLHGSKTAPCKALLHASPELGGTQSETVPFRLCRFTCTGAWL